MQELSDSNCENVLNHSSISKNRSTKDIPKYFLKGQVHNASLKKNIIHEIMQTDPNEFWARIPQELRKPIQNNSYDGSPLGFSIEMVRKFSEGYVFIEPSESVSIYTPVFVHGSPHANAKEIFDSQTPRLASGVRNAHAFCMYHTSYYLGGKDFVLLSIQIDPNAKVVDIREPYITRDGTRNAHSFFSAYEWYSENIVKLISNHYPDIWNLLKRDPHNAANIMGTKEMFAIFLDADLIRTNEKYDAQFRDETWLINPGVVTSVRSNTDFTR